MRILLVEDDPDLTRQLKQALDDAGYAVDHAPDGEEAAFLGETEPYDAIVLDLGLPKIDGASVLEGWRRANLATPVLILTARGAWSEKVAGFDAGADDYLTKPFHTEELLARLLAAQRYRSAAEHLRARLEDESGYRFRSAPPPAWLRKTTLQDAGAVYEPAVLASAIGDLMQVPPPVDVRHMTVAKVTVAERLAHLRKLLTAGRFTFSDAVGRADRVTVAVTLYALLELYKQGEATWVQDEPFAEITISGIASAAQRLTA